MTYTKLVLVLVLGFFPGCAHSEPKIQDSIQLEPDRIVRLIDAIDISGLAVANRIMTLAAQNPSRPIDILITSPGGLIITGETIVAAIDAVKSRGVVVRCVVPFLAASMAFSIFHHCSERYALPKANLLFHPSRVSAEVLTGLDAAEIALQLLKVDGELVEDLRSMGMDEDVFMKTFLGEKLWTGIELQAETKSGYIILVRDILGVPDLFSVQRGRN